MDVVYIVRPGENPELRWSLRSIEKNFTYDNLHIVGGMPDWVTGVNFHPLPRKATKYRTTEANLEYACRNPDVSDNFALMMDDVFFLKKMSRIPVHNRGPVREVIEHYRATRKQWSPYLQGMEDTLALLEANGFKDPLSFELHIPMVVNKKTMLKAIEMGRSLNAPHKRTIYGALAGLKGTRIDDVKVYRPEDELPHGAAWVSSQDRSFSYGVGHLVRWLYPHPGRYEAD